MRWGYNLLQGAEADDRDHFTPNLIDNLSPVSNICYPEAYISKFQTSQKWSTLPAFVISIWFCFVLTSDFLLLAS